MYKSKDSGFTLFGTRIHVNPNANFSECNDEAPDKATIDGHPCEEDAAKVDESSIVEEEGRTEDEAIEKGRERPEKIIPCPRCRSMDTKFCYFNNYNVNQPRHFCRNCQRYWTSGGAMRSVPVGAGRRKTKPSPPAIACEPAEDNSVIDNNIVSTSTTSASSMMTSELPGPRHEQQHVPHPAVYCYPAAANYPWGFPGFYPGSAPVQFVTGPYWGCVPFWPGGGPGGAVPASSATASSSCSSGNALGKHGREEDKTPTVDEPKAGDVPAKRTLNNKRVQ